MHLESSGDQLMLRTLPLWPLRGNTCVIAMV